MICPEIVPWAAFLHCFPNRSWISSHFVASSKQTGGIGHPDFTRHRYARGVIKD
jgi:hypothetical protein